MRETAAALAATPGLVARLREAASARPATSPAREAVLISIRDLSFRYGRRGHAGARRRISVHRRGRFLAIAGANGAGKTTLASLLRGVVVEPPGDVSLEGEDVAAMREAELSGRVGYVFQNPEHQFVADSVHDELAFSLLPRAAEGRQPLTAAQEQLVEEWLERLGLLPLAEANPFSLSQGQKRRLSVAAMLMRGQ